MGLIPDPFPPRNLRRLAWLSVVVAAVGAALGAGGEALIPLGGGCVLFGVAWARARYGW